jgi:hypothetical protein
MEVVETVWLGEGVLWAWQLVGVKLQIPWDEIILQPGMNISRLGLQILQNMKMYMAPNSGNWQIKLQKLVLGFI